MKIISTYLILTIFFCGCTLKQNAISKIEDYNDELKDLSPLPNKKLDTALINLQYNELEISNISEEILVSISEEAELKELLKTEKSLLSLWEPIPNFKSYYTSKPDTLKLRIRCSSFDRAPQNIERIPSARGMRTISLRYYQIEIPVAFHIISNKKGEGILPDMMSKITNQIQTLNNTYNKFNIKFKLFSTEVTVNDNWFSSASYYTSQKALGEMTKSLSKDPSRIMNVYSLAPPKILGEASYPWYPENGTSLDYIVINFNTLPNGPSSYFNGDYNQGKTLVHEVGHFLGLFHTFEGGNFDCDKNPPHDGCTIGDQVDDTPSQLICYFDGCNTNSDSCPSPGKDPVKNYMGYNPDACMSEFSNGQIDRMLQSIIKFRYYFVINPI